MGSRQAWAIARVSLALTLSACAHVGAEREPAAGRDPAQSFSGKAWEIIAAKASDAKGEIGGYTDIYAASDLHGHLDAFRGLLEQAGLVAKIPEDAPRTQVPRWLKKNVLLVLLGDYINSDERGIDDSAQLLVFLRELKPRAAAQGSRIITLLGNHEAWAMGYSAGNRPEDHMQASFLESVARELGEKKKKIDAADLKNAGIWDDMLEMPLGAVVGDWVFIHGGYFKPKKNQTLKDYLAELNATWLRANAGSAEDFATLGDDTVRGKEYENNLGCPLSAHQWYTDRKRNGDKRRDEVRALLKSAGISVMFVGHEKDIFDDPKLEKKIVLNKPAWLVKLDSGLKEGGRGEMLHCPVADLRKRGDAPGELRLTDEDTVLCRRIVPGDDNGKRVRWIGRGPDE